VYFPSLQGYASTPVYERDHLACGQVINGPAVVEERVSTTILGPGDRLTVEQGGAMVIALGSSAREKAAAGKAKVSA